MAKHSLTTAFTGPYSVVANGLLQHGGGSPIEIVVAASMPANDADALILAEDFDVIRASGDRTFFARAQNATALLRVVPAL
ncbi:hypothetical protein [Paracoccus litorisediminis]|uniref:Uncharacterized protein n=1 Tax=Paracoccus litorisediminis TaxID=2006130 RepID=A0A844HQK5_9RHOB|nr:hypothetical protein [Paracoccus litorisediminis]MTH62126.1 hypothetical protein [Paracoccus litorisediminis]